MTISELFNSLSTGASWSAGVSFTRSNPLPLDKYSIFKSKADADDYIANNPVAYPGQIISVIEEVVNEETQTTSVIATVYVVSCNEYNIDAETQVVSATLNLVELATTENAADDVEATLSKLVEDIANHEERIVTLEEEAEKIDAIKEELGIPADQENGPTGIYKLINDLESLVNGLELGDKIDVKQDTLGNESAISIEESDGVKYLNVKVDGSSIVINSDGKLQAKLTAENIENLTDYSVTLETADGTADDDFSKVYTLKQGAAGSQTTIGSINIPKDMVVSSGTVETYTEENLPDGVSIAGTYIVLKLANANADTIYIPASALLDDKAISGGTTNDITISVSDSNEITATLSSSVTEKLNKIDTLEQSINSLGIAANKDYSTTVQADDENLITSGGVATYVSNYVTENVVVPTHGELNEDATDDTYASSQDVYEALSVYRV